MEGLGVMGVLKCFIFVGVTIFASACSMEALSEPEQNAIEDSGEPVRYSLKEISRSVNGMDGRLVVVRGYLTGWGPIMMLVENADANPFNKKKPTLLVSDTELRLKILSGNQYYDLLRYIDSLGCIERFVDIVGEIGLIGEEEYNGITRIETISTFENDSYSGEGQLCYSS